MGDLVRSMAITLPEYSGIYITILDYSHIRLAPSPYSAYNGHICTIISMRKVSFAVSTTTHANAYLGTFNGVQHL